MKTPFHLCLLLAGTVLMLSPVIYKTVIMITLAVVVVKEHRADLNVGPIEPYLGLCIVCGIAMIIIAIISNARVKNER